MRILLRPACLRSTTWLFNCRMSDWCDRMTYLCGRTLTWVCDRDLWRLCVGFLLFVLVFVLSVLYVMRDPCDTAAATRQLCEDYDHGYVAGSLCYDLCVSKTFSLPKCLSKSSDVMTFHSKKSIAKLKISSTEYSSSESDQFNLPFHLRPLEGRLSNDDFYHLLERFLTSKLGPVDLTSLIDRLYQFADASHDGKINFGEASSLWDLLRIHEFFILFLFQGDMTFPFINGTCGSLYMYDKTFIPELYDKMNKGFLNHIFFNTYRWNLPKWDKRVNVAIGLLENVVSLSEQANSPFHMCNLDPTKFGYTERFEAKLTHFEDIVAQHHLEKEIQGQPCGEDSDCRYGDCVTECESGKCTGELKHPTLARMCTVLEEYLVFDAPTEVKTQLKVLVTQCSHFTSRGEEGRNPTQAIRYNLLLDELTRLLWDQVKSKPVSWLDVPKKKNRPS